MVAAQPISHHGAATQRSIGSRCVAIALATALAACLLAPATVSAQPGHGERVREFIEQTEEILTRSREVVEDSQSDRARRVLEEGWQLHQRSRGEFDAGRPVMALRLSQGARQAAIHATRLARREAGLDDRAQQRYERFRERRDRLTDRAQAAASEPALRFIQEAENQAQRARDQFAQNNFALALQLLDAADGLLDRAARLLMESGDLELLVSELERTAELITRVAERLAAEPNRDAERLLEEARAALDRAWAHLDRREPLAARNAGRLARELTTRAANRTESAPAARAVQEQIERWDRRAEIVAEAVRAAESAEAQRVFDQAREHRDRAVTRYEAGEREEALREIKTAHDLLHRADELTR